MSVCWMGVNSDVLDDNAAFCPNEKKNLDAIWFSGKCRTSPLSPLLSLLGRE